MAARKAIPITESVVTLKITVTTSSTGKVTPTNPIRLKKRAAIRNIAINATAHDVDNEITVRAGEHTIVDGLPDLQSFSTAPHSDPDQAPQIDQDDEITAFVQVPTAPASTVTYLISITYWEIEYEGEHA